MADYDPKSIPILDDVIDIDVDSNTRGERKNTESLVTIDNDALESAVENTSPSIGEIDEVDEFINPEQSIDINTVDNTTEENTVTDTALDLDAVDAPKLYKPEAYIPTLDEAAPDEPEPNEPEPYESALIGYLNDDPEDNKADENRFVEPVATTTAFSSDEVARNPDAKVSKADTTNTEPSKIDTSKVEPPKIEPLEIEPLVNDIVHQLLPDLEQQLRYLVQQALEEKLPADLVKPVSSDESNDS